MISTDATWQPGHRFALFALGFRPFFLFAALYSIFITAVWFAVYILHLKPPLSGTPVVAWHAHEMIFGYGAAVVGGFLLTATQNWTGLKTLHSWPLALLLVSWLIPRITPFAWPSVTPVLLATFDIAFITGLIGATGRVILKSGSKKQLIIVSLLALLLLSNAAYYLDQAGILPGGMRAGNYSGLCVLLGLIFILARRVFPFFTEKGVGYPVRLTNHAWVDKISLAAFALFWIAEVTQAGDLPRAVLSGVLFLLHAIRLWGWHTHGIWAKPLLWALYLGYAFITAGFLLNLLSITSGISPHLGIHAFAYGGIGLMTLGMMSRVSLGHTGRNIHQPPKVLIVVFGTLVAGTLFRVVAPLIEPASYPLWIGLSQVLWVIAFSLFIVLFANSLIRPRVDGKPG